MADAGKMCSDMRTVLSSDWSTGPRVGAHAEHLGKCIHSQEPVLRQRMSTPAPLWLSSRKCPQQWCPAMMPGKLEGSAISARCKAPDAELVVLHGGARDAAYPLLQHPAHLSAHALQHVSSQLQAKVEMLHSMRAPELQ